MEKMLLYCLILLLLFGLVFSTNAENAGNITLEFIQYNNEMKISSLLENPSQYGIATISSLKPTEFTSMNIKVAKVENGVETTCWESNVTVFEDISISLDSGTYRIYSQLEGDDTVLEYNNDSEGYTITPQSHLVIPMVYSPVEGYILDIPWRIENTEIHIPVLSIHNDWLTSADINNIYVYDHNNGDSLVALTNWDSSQPINSSNMPFFYLFNIDKNSFVQVDGEVSIRIKFDLHLCPDNWEGPINVRISSNDIPKVTDWYCGDVHLHTNYTNNAMEFGAPIYATRASNNAMGLDWMIITDHSFDLDTDMWDIMSLECDTHSNNTFRVLQGEEVSCYIPDTDTIPGRYQYNHLLIYGADFIPGGEWEDNTGSDYTPAEVIDIVNNQGGVTYPAHPMDNDPFRDPWQDYSLNYNGLQIWNYGSPENIVKLEKGIELWKGLLKEGRYIYIEGGTDAHGDFNTLAGRVKTYTYIPGYNQTTLPPENDILEALRNGHSIMTDGPLVIFNITNEHGEIAIIGDEIAGSDLTLNIQWESIEEFGKVDWINVWQGIVGEEGQEQIIKTFSVDSFSGNVIENITDKIPSGKISYVRIEAGTQLRIDYNGNPEDFKVYTNPIWITVMRGL